MSSSVDSQFDPEYGEEIVAYLDGELSPVECRRVEERLASDPAFREQVQRLDQAWAALEVLPEPTVDDAFARTTIEMVAVAAEKDLQEKTRALPVQRRKRTFVSAVIAVVSLSLGLALAAVTMPDPNGRLVRNLPEIWQVDVYTQFEDVDFLRDVRKVFDAEEGQSGNEPLVMSSLATFGMLSTAKNSERRDWIEALPVYEKELLLGKARRFDDLSEREQRRIEKLHESLLSADDSDSLQETLIIYGQWLSEQTPGEQARLKDLPVDERLERIRELKGRELRCLSSGDAAALRGTLQAVLRERMNRQREGDRERGPEPRNPNGEFQGAMGYNKHLIARWFSQAIGRGRRGQELTERLLQPLDPETQQYFRSLPERKQREQMKKWIVIALGKPHRRRSNPEDLQEVFSEDLTNDERERLLSMPWDDMQEQLEEQYQRQQESQRRFPFERMFEGRPFDDDRPRGGPPPRGGDRPPRRRGPGPDDGRFREGPPGHDRPKPPPPPGEPVI